MHITCDSSVLVAGLASWHPNHLVARDALESRVTKLVGHTLLECTSVLTRLPSQYRIAPATVHAALVTIERPIIGLNTDEYAPLLARLSQLGVQGGAVYDGLIAATAQAAGILLLTADARARATYDAVGVRFEVLGD